MSAQPVLSAAAFRNQWNDLVRKLAALGDSEQARQLNANLLLGEIQASTNTSQGQWLAQCGDGDQIWFSAPNPATALTRVVIETPAVGTWVGPGRIAPAVMWTMSFFHPEHSSQAIEQQAVQLMQGLVKQQSSEISEDGDHYRLSASANGSLHFEAQRSTP